MADKITATTDTNTAELTLDKDFLERRGFGSARPQPGKDHGPGPGCWAETAAHCSILRRFLDNQTGGVLLVAGPRGIGKTSIVRRELELWEKKHGKAKRRRKCNWAMADAADLGMLEAGASTSDWERYLIRGILRAIQRTFRTFACRDFSIF